MTHSDAVASISKTFVFETSGGSLQSGVLEKAQQVSAYLRSLADDPRGASAAAPALGQT